MNGTRDEARGRFEKWAFEQTELEEGTERDIETGCYLDEQMEIAWSAWQAGERAGLERAAQKAHEWTLQSCKEGQGHEDNPCCHARTGAGIEAAIRALAAEGGGE